MMDKQIDDKLVIIILNYNDYIQTQGCIDSLLEANVSVDIVVVDNCSTDNSYNILRDRYNDYKHIKVIKSEKNGGYSYGNNYGIRYARTIREYDYICIMNPDVILDSNCLGKLCTVLFEHKEIAVISSLMFLNGRFNPQNMAWNIPNEKEIYRELSIIRKAKKENLVFEVIEDSIVKAEVVPGSFFIIKTEIYDEIGGLDEGTFLYNEENILGIKLKKRGLVSAIDTSSHYRHNHITVSKESVWRKYRECFQQVTASYQANYQSRKYLCMNYYNSKYLFRLRFIQFTNLLAIYTKHIISRLCYQKKDEYK